MAANLKMTIRKSNTYTNINEECKTDDPIKTINIIKKYLDSELSDYQSPEDTSQDTTPDTSPDNVQDILPSASQDTNSDSDIDVENIEDDTLTSSVESLNERLEKLTPKDSEHQAKPPPYTPHLSSDPVQSAPPSSNPVPSAPPPKKVTFNNKIQTKL